jgi:hypothetical protein
MPHTDISEQIAAMEDSEIIDGDVYFLAREEHAAHDEPAGYDEIDGRPIYHPKAETARMPGGSPIFPSSDSKTREESPVVTGVLDYFPLALLELAKFSRWGNLKHNGPDAPLHWSRGKSTDHANKIGRHLLERGTLDPDTGGTFSHSVGLAWRALALLQKELEMAAGYDRDDLDAAYRHVVAAREAERDACSTCKCGTCK